jgi:tripartite ATP-independent transporter DctP family solute receptor
MKKTLIGNLVLGAVMSLLLGFSAETRAAEFNVKFAHVLVPDTPAGKASEMFSKLIGERTKGRIEVKVFASGQLGNDTQIVEQVQLNTVQMGIPPTAVLGQFEPRLQLIDLPFLFPKREACYDVLDGEVGRALLEGLSKKGFKGLAYWESGFKQITTRGKQINGPADLKGLKIRTMDSPLIIEQYRAWGANPVPISFGETYNALQQKVVDGQENPLVSIDRMKFYEVQDFLTISNHAYLGYGVLINQKFWDGLPKDLADVFQKTMEEVRNWQREESKKLDQQLIEKMQKAGIKVNSLSPEGVKEFIRASAPVYKKYETIVGKDLLDKSMQVGEKYLK